MPYIKQHHREHMRQQTSFPLMAGPGQLNFFLCETYKEYLRQRGEWRYQDLNDILGAIEGSRAEFYEHVIKLYEQKKIEENGTVW